MSPLLRPARRAGATIQRDALVVHVAAIFRHDHEPAAATPLSTTPFAEEEETRGEVRGRVWLPDDVAICEAGRRALRRQRNMIQQVKRAQITPSQRRTQEKEIHA